MSYIFVSLAVLFNVGFTGLLKVSAQSGPSLWARYGWMYAAFWFGAANAYFFSRSLEKLDLGIAYPIYSGASVMVTITLGLLAFNEQISMSKGLGALAILGGIYLVKR
jgi:quaternary ammonium compound-resistance protein SugE